VNEKPRTRCGGVVEGEEGVNESMAAAISRFRRKMSIQWTQLTLLGNRTDGAPTAASESGAEYSSINFTSREVTPTPLLSVGLFISFF
jgi:hypothetical protein